MMIKRIDLESSLCPSWEGGDNNWTGLAEVHVHHLHHLHHLHHVNFDLPGGEEATGIAGLAEALERELKGIRCEISVIADKIR